MHFFWRKLEKTQADTGRTIQMPPWKELNPEPSYWEEKSANHFTTMPLFFYHNSLLTIYNTIHPKTTTVWAVFVFQAFKGWSLSVEFTLHIITKSKTSKIKSVWIGKYLLESKPYPQPLLLQCRCSKTIRYNTPTTLSRWHKASE